MARSKPYSPIVDERECAECPNVLFKGFGCNHEGYRAHTNCCTVCPPREAETRPQGRGAAQINKRET